MQSNIASVCNLHFHDHISYTMTKCVNQTIVKNGAGSSLYHSLALLQIFVWDLLLQNKDMVLAHHCITV